MISLRNILKETNDQEAINNIARKLPFKIPEEHHEDVIHYFYIVNNIMNDSHRQPYTSLSELLPNYFVDNILRPKIIFNFGKRVRAYKGMSFSGDDIEELKNGIFDVFSHINKQVDISKGNQRGIMGWTTDLAIAQNFAKQDMFGVVVEATIPVDQIVYMSKAFEQHDELYKMSEAVSDYMFALRSRKRMSPNVLAIYDMYEEDELMVDHRPKPITCKVIDIMCVANRAAKNILDSNYGQYQKYKTAADMFKELD